MLGFDSARGGRDRRGRQQGTELVGKLQGRLDALHARLRERPLVHVLFVVWEEPLITIGQNTFIADALRWAGAESVRAIEAELAAHEHRGSRAAAARLHRLHERSWRGELRQSSLTCARVRRGEICEAVEQGHVVDVSEEAIRPSPGLVDMIEQLARQLHPEAFSAESHDSWNNKRISKRRAVRRRALG